MQNAVRRGVRCTETSLSTCTGTVPAGGETIFAIIIKHRKHGFQITIKTNRVKIVIRLP